MKKTLEIISKKNTRLNLREENESLSYLRLGSADPHEYEKIIFSTFNIDCFIFARKCQYFGIPADVRSEKIKTIEDKVLFDVYTADESEFAKSLSEYFLKRIITLNFF